jgi:hypothetical protein
MIRNGSRVVYIGDPRNLTGIVKDLHWEAWLNVATHATVEWDDISLAPRQMKVPMVELRLCEESPTYGLTIQDCECGLKHITGGGEHSTWCKLYGKGIYPWNS